VIPVSAAEKICSQNQKLAFLSEIAWISSRIRYNLGSHLKESVSCHEETHLESGD